MTPPKPKTPKGRFKNVEAFHDLIERWRQKAAAEGWGLGHSYDECADDLEELVGKPKVVRDDEKDRGY